MVTHASASTLEACLTALPRERLQGVVVVDNASPDDSPALARRCGVTVIEQGNVGFGAGCNRGLAALPDAELVLFLNPDAVISAQDLEALVAYLDGRPGCAVVGPRLYRDGQPLSSAGGPAGLLSELRLVVPARLSRLFPDRRLPADFAETGPVGYVEGACLLVRANALHSLGGFDEAFFLFFEELDLARRLKRRGLTVDLLASARAEHLVAVSRGVLSDGGRGHLLRSTVLHLRRLAPWKAWLYVQLACLSLRVRTGVDPQQSRSWRHELRAALRGAR